MFFCKINNLFFVIHCEIVTKCLIIKTTTLTFNKMYQKTICVGVVKHNLLLKKLIQVNLSPCRLEFGKEK